MSADRTLFDDDIIPELPWDAKAWGLAAAATRNLFNPSSPIDADRLFSGRISQVQDTLDIIYERGAHAVLFGERGVGKSSLANTISSRIPTAVTNIKFLKDNCRPEDTFFGLWSKMLWNFQYEGTDISEYLKEETREFIVIKMLESLSAHMQYVFIFDEFDRIADKMVKIAMADTIKHFSDYPQNVTIIIVGVGSSIEELFGAHPSIQRCCRQIPMQRMSDVELSDIIDDRYRNIKIRIGDSLKAEMIDLCQGMPGFVHLAAREAAISAINRKSRNVESIDYRAAIKESVRVAQASIITAYKKATYSPKENIYAIVLLACALARRDEQGKFSASDTREALRIHLGRQIEISGFARHLAAFCDEERGAVLKKTGKPKRFQYQFIDAPLQPYVVMVGKRDGLI
jgi:Cdc6-like AAA superfamily ATPase